MMNSEVKKAALADTELLDRVVKFKEKFYRCSWAQYDKAKIGTIKLLPPQRNMQALKDDYDHMQNMIFGDKPAFDTIINGIAILENEINNIYA